MQLTPSQAIEHLKESAVGYLETASAAKCSPCPLAANTHEYLRGEEESPIIHRPSARVIASAALDRWVLPRAQRRPEFRTFEPEMFLGEYCGVTEA